MLATVLWEYISPVELLTIAASLTATIAVVVDLFLIVSKNIAPWKKTAVLFIVSELAAAVVSCWLGASFVTIVGVRFADGCNLVFDHIFFHNQVGNQIKYFLRRGRCPHRPYGDQAERADVHQSAPTKFYIISERNLTYESNLPN